MPEVTLPGCGGLGQPASGLRPVAAGQGDQPLDPCRAQHLAPPVPGHRLPVLRQALQGRLPLTLEGDPVCAARHIRQALAAEGSWLIVEPLAGDTLADNLNPVGRVYYSFSSFVCVPNARSQPGGYALGAQAGEAAIRQVAGQAGFSRFRRAAETPFNAVFEARP